jgi:hypothetical protein
MFLEEDGHARALYIASGSGTGSSKTSLDCRPEFLHE